MRLKEVPELGTMRPRFQSCLCPSLALCSSLLCSQAVPVPTEGTWRNSGEQKIKFQDSALYLTKFATGSNTFNISQPRLPCLWNRSDITSWAAAIYKFLAYSRQRKLQVQRPCGTTLSGHVHHLTDEGTKYEPSNVDHSAFTGGDKEDQSGHVATWGGRANWWQSKDWNQTRIRMRQALGTKFKARHQNPSSWDKKRFSEIFKKKWIQTNLWWTKYQNFKPR